MLAMKMLAVKAGLVAKRHLEKCIWKRSRNYNYDFT
jgi:hypothetical protein